MFTGSVSESNVYVASKQSNLLNELSADWIEIIAEPYKKVVVHILHEQLKSYQL